VRAIIIQQIVPEGDRKGRIVIYFDTNAELLCKKLASITIIFISF